MTGEMRIAAERQRQLTEEGWAAAHDDTWGAGELALAAAAYALAAADSDTSYDGGLWPFHPDWRKPSTDRIRNLEKAGALIAAEIDRLSRDAARAAVGGQE